MHGPLPNSAAQVPAKRHRRVHVERMQMRNKEPSKKERVLACVISNVVLCCCLVADLPEHMHTALPIARKRIIEERSFSKCTHRQTYEAFDAHLADHGKMRPERQNFRLTTAEGRNVLHADWAHTLASLFGESVHALVSVEARRPSSWEHASKFAALNDLLLRCIILQSMREANL